MKSSTFNSFRMIMAMVAALALSIVCAPRAFPSAQDESIKIDKSRIPAEADNANAFAPQGWKIEEQVEGDLNGDSIPDYALKLVEDKPAKTDNDVANERQRALVVVLKDSSGKLLRAGVADSLLQCTACGGAFYGVMEAPADVTIEKGVLVVQQESGSNTMSHVTYRFRFEPGTKRFALIGFDYVYNDRRTAEVVSESTNYLTGVRITSRDVNGKEKSTKKTISKQKIYLEQVNDDDFAQAANKRLNL